MEKADYFCNTLKCVGQPSCFCVSSLCMKQAAKCYMVVVMSNQNLESSIKSLPSTPGVYQFKDEQGQIVYIGKAKNLRKRVMNYLQRQGYELKADLILEASIQLDYIETKTELEAMLLEARLIQSHQPKFNILLKSGQPFLYILITSSKTPELKLVRNQQLKGSYFGPFLEKGPARKVCDFLLKTFRLKLCKKKIENGCLDYHMGLCSGSCRSDFDQVEYIQRMELARTALKQGHAKFLTYLKQQIEVSNREQTFEKSRELHSYYKAFSSVFDALDAKGTVNRKLDRKDIWILTSDRRTLFLFDEINGAFKKREVFYFPFIDDINFEQEQAYEQLTLEHMTSFYRTHVPSATIFVNFEMNKHERSLLEEFCHEWHKLSYDISVTQPVEGHGAALVRLGKLHAQQDEEKRMSLGRQLRVLLKLPFEPKTIDCFDISHKQGMFMVGSCVRFKNGEPDKSFFRKFHIKTVHQIDDYASLREIVARRYADGADLPDLIVIDGGKGQLNAVQDLFPHAEFACLAKREETIFSNRIPEGRKLDLKSFVGQMLIALRDYAHHFAISFHRTLEKF